MSHAWMGAYLKGDFLRRANLRIYNNWFMAFYIILCTWRFWIVVKWLFLALFVYVNDAFVAPLLLTTIMHLVGQLCPTGQYFVAPTLSSQQSGTWWFNRSHECGKWGYFRAFCNGFMESFISLTLNLVLGFMESFMSFDPKEYFHYSIISS